MDAMQNHSQAPPGQDPPGQPPPADPTSPATMAAPNAGMEAAGLARLNMVVRMLEEVLPMFGAASEVGQTVLKSVTSLAKHIPAGSMSSGVEQTAMKGVMNSARQQAPLIAALRAQMGGQQQQPPQQPQAM